LEFGNEKEDNSSIKPDINVKRKGLETFSQVKPIELNSPPQTQLEVGQSSQQPFSSSTSKKDILPTMGSLYMGRM
jgi:hypothetical protein